MLEIEFETNIDKKILVFQKLKNVLLPESRRSAGSSTGFFISEEIRKYIESAGRGGWEKAHPMTALFERRGGEWQRRKGFVSPYYGLGKFARYLINRSATEIRMGFGTFRGKDAAKGKSVYFSKTLQEIGEQAQKQRTITVTDRMRKLLGATRSKPGQKPGIDFCPLRRGTSQITVSPRPFSVPVFQQVKGQSFTLFAERFKKALEKRFEKE
jgi:hypothetical protein